MRCAKCGHSWHQAPPTDLPRKIELEAEEVPARRQPERMQMEARSPAQAAQPEPAQEARAPAASPRDEPETPSAASAAAEPVAEAVAEAIRAVSQAGAASASASQLGSGGRLRAFLDQAASTRRGRVVAVIGWAALIAFVASTLYSAFRFREDIAVLWPTTAKLYAAVDKPVNLRGIEFRNVAYERQAENGLPVLAVKGEIVNVSRERRVLPRLRVGLRDKNQRELYHWTFALPEKELAPQQAAEFATRLSSPPVEARDLEVRFVLRGEDAASLPVQEGEEAPAVRSR